MQTAYDGSDQGPSRKRIVLRATATGTSPLSITLPGIPNYGTYSASVTGWFGNSGDAARAKFSVVYYKAPTSSAMLSTQQDGTTVLTPGQQMSAMTMAAPTIATRAPTDGVLNSTPTVTSATAAFTSADVGQPITGTGIPAGTKIAAVISATTAILTAAATATASGVTLTISSAATMTVTLTSARAGTQQGNVQVVLYENTSEQDEYNV